VLITHYHVNEARLPQIAELCRIHGAYLFDDCAISFGGSINGRPDWYADRRQRIQLLLVQAAQLRLGRSDYHTQSRCRARHRRDRRDLAPAGGA
jgi:hypothetical protein